MVWLLTDHAVENSHLDLSLLIKTMPSKTSEQPPQQQQQEEQQAPQSPRFPRPSSGHMMHRTAGNIRGSRPAASDTRLTSPLPSSLQVADASSPFPMTPAGAAGHEQNRHDEDGGDGDSIEYIDATAPSASQNEHGNAEDIRQGTVLSASINILSTMVGGGSLSLPLAFTQAGIGAIAPITLVVIAISSEFCMHCLVEGGNAVVARRRRTAAATVTETDETRQGTLSYELIASEAFGPKGYTAAMLLVSVVCYFATVGYAVLLRDLLEPFADAAANMFDGGTGGNSTNSTNVTDIFGSSDYLRGSEGVDPSILYSMSALSNSTMPSEDPTTGPTLARNFAMCIVVLIMTPFCLLTNLTALKNVGLMSMAAVLILGCIIVYRSSQCNLGSTKDGNDVFATPSFLFNDDTSNEPLTMSAGRHPRHSDWYDYITYVPSNLRSFITAFPIFISCFICHYNVPPIHNELQNPTKTRVHSWLRGTMVTSTLFYLVVGFAGSMYGNCTSDGAVHGNILLDFDEDDVLLLIGRSCLALTIALAFPMLVIPPRDIVIRAILGSKDRDNDANDRSRRIGPPSRSFNLLRGGVEASFDDEDNENVFDPVEGDIPSALTQPLLLDHENGHFDPESPHTAEARENVDGESGSKKNENADFAATQSSADERPSHGSACLRAVTAISIFWSGAAIASSVKSIDIVWDLLGSSLSICLGFLIPCACYLALCPMNMEDGMDLTAGEGGGMLETFNRSVKRKCARIFAWFIIIVLTPMMFVCTANAAYNTFFK